MEFHNQARIVVMCIILILIVVFNWLPVVSNRSALQNLYLYTQPEVNRHQDMGHNHTGSDKVQSMKNSSFFEQVLTDSDKVESKNFSYFEQVLAAGNFQEDITGCSVKVFESEKIELTAYIAKNNPVKRNCSPEVFKDYIRESDQLYGDGAWYMPEPRSTHGAVFYPETCKFDENLFKNDNLMKCFKKKHLVKIVVTGDSNGYRYFEGLKTAMMKGFDKCTLHEPTNGVCNETYYKIPGKPSILNKSRAYCDCRCRSYKCRGKLNAQEINVSLEMYPADRLLDYRVKFSHPEKMRNTFYGNKQNFNENLARDYFASQGFPDLWIVSPLMHHMIWQTNLTEYKSQYNKLINILDHYLPKTTQILLLTDHRSCLSLMPRSVLNKMHKKPYSHWWAETDINRVIHGFTQAVSDIIKQKVLEPGSRFHSFLNMERVICPVSCILHDNGAHLLKNVYPMLASHMLQYFCGHNKN